MKKNKKKMLLTGVSGQLGSNLAWYFRKNYDVLGLYNFHEVKIEGVRTEKVDILFVAPLKKIIQDFHPDILVHCASLVDIEYCEFQKELTQRVNVGGTRNIIECIQDNACKAIYFSSDSVYDGGKGNFEETDSVNPQNYYGFSKHEGELEFLKKKESLVLRTNIFGWNIQNKDSLAEWILNELSAGRSIEGFEDVYFSSIYNFNLARILEMAIDKDISGIYNCGSSTSLTKYQFALRIAERFNLNSQLIRPISIDNYSFQAKRGKNLSLNITKLEKALNYKFPMMDDCIEAFYQDYKNGLHIRIRANSVSYEGTKPPFLFYGKQEVDQEDIQAVSEVLTSSNLTQGPKVQAFESALCRTVDVPFAVACNSGTSALHIACLAAGIEKGDEVITSPITFVASANCAVYCGAKPVFADIDPRTYNISVEEIEKRISKRTRAIIPVHFAGQSCDMERIREIVCNAQKKYGKKIYIIEDGCHALGSLYGNTKVGSCTYSDMTVMSFHPVKHITTGEGGVIFAKDPSLAKKQRLLRSHGITSDPEEFLNMDLAFQEENPQERNPWYYEMIDIGFNYRITDIQCALGLSQLKKLDRFKRQRRIIVNKYNQLFKNLERIQIPFENPDCDSNFHLYVLLFDFLNMTMDRARLMLELRIRRIQTQVHYIPVHLQSFYRRTFGYQPGDYPVAEAYYSKCLSIPLFPAMTEADAERVFCEIQQLINKH